MTNLGLPVPPGFTITTEACKAYMAAGDQIPDGLMDEVAGVAHRARGQDGQAARRPADPLLVSVRSGAPFSMPGMMDTVLNLGLNDVSVGGLAQADRQRAVRVRLLPPLRADVRQDRARHRRRALRGRAHRAARAARRRDRPRASADDLRGCRDGSRRSCCAETGIEFPQEPHEQLRATRSRRCSSRGTASARASTARWRRSPTTSAPRSTCRRWCSATRATTPAPASRSRATRRRARTGPTATSSPTRRARTSSPASASPSRSTRWPTTSRSATRSCSTSCSRSSATTATCATSSSPSSRAGCSSCRRASASAPPRAALRMAVEMEGEGLIDKREAVLRVEPAQLDQLLHPQFDPTAKYDGVAKGLNASPGCGGRQGRTSPPTPPRRITRRASA